MLQRVAYFFFCFRCLPSIATKLFAFGRPDEAADGAGDESEFAYEQANPGRPMTTDAVAVVFFSPLSCYGDWEVFYSTLIAASFDARMSSKMSKSYFDHLYLLNQLFFFLKKLSG